jgi:hypothetical protein
MGITLEQHEQINLIAFDRSASTFLCSYDADELQKWVNGEISDEEFLDSPETSIWEPFETYPFDAIAENITDTARSFYQFAEQIADLLQPATTTN